MKINSGQILSISQSDYLDTSGKEQSQSGVILSGGDVITVEKGGVLSVSGDLINNGLIINNGGTIIVQDGGSIFPFLQGDDEATLGCGGIQCNGGDIIIEEGGAIYSGMNTGDGSQAYFYLDNSSTLINYGVLVYGTLNIGDGSRIENRLGGKIYGSYYEKNLSTFSEMVNYNTKKLMKGNHVGLLGISEFGKAYEAHMGGLFPHIPSGWYCVPKEGKSEEEIAAARKSLVDRGYIITVDNKKFLYYASYNKDFSFHVLCKRGYQSDIRDDNMSSYITLETMEL